MPLGAPLPTPKSQGEKNRACQKCDRTVKSRPKQPHTLRSLSSICSVQCKNNIFPPRRKIKMKKPLQRYLKTMQKEESQLYSPAVLNGSLRPVTSLILSFSLSAHSLLLPHSLLSLLPGPFPIPGSDKSKRWQPSGSGDRSERCPRVTPSSALPMRMHKKPTREGT